MLFLAVLVSLSLWLQKLLVYKGLSKVLLQIFGQMIQLGFYNFCDRFLLFTMINNREPFLLEQTNRGGAVFPFNRKWRQCCRVPTIIQVSDENKCGHVGGQLIWVWIISASVWFGHSKQGNTTERLTQSRNLHNAPPSSLRTGGWLEDWRPAQGP